MFSGCIPIKTLTNKDKWLFELCKIKTLVVGQRCLHSPVFHLNVLTVKFGHRFTVRWTQTNSAEENWGHVATGSPSLPVGAPIRAQMDDTYPPITVLLSQHHQHLPLTEAQLIVVVGLAVVQRLDAAGRRTPRLRESQKSRNTRTPSTQAAAAVYYWINKLHWRRTPVFFRLSLICWGLNCDAGSSKQAVCAHPAFQAQTLYPLTQKVVTFVSSRTQNEAIVCRLLHSSQMGCDNGEIWRLLIKHVSPHVRQRGVRTAKPA